ncbi:AAA family ATPase [Streptomyces sp. NPDC048438]|uniref:helix-turn-helix transcriptional regulator n=1 Tax=Streptomyces sp. NPDC048438 TaxID=3365551 RepID=UPI003724642B
MSYAPFADAAHPPELREIAEAVTGPGPGGTILLSGMPGIGKSTLLEQAAQHARAAGHRVLRAVAGPAEAALPFATLHQLLRPVRDAVTELPVRQRAALQGAFGLGETGDPPDPMLLGVAVLTLLSELATEAPVLALLDDAQRADRASLDVLAFVARRIGEERVSLLIAVENGDSLTGFDAHRSAFELGPVEPAVAERLLDRQPRPPVGEARRRVLDESEGNPLALVELAGTVASEGEPGAGGAAPAIATRLVRRWGDRLTEMGRPARHCLLVLALSAADPAEPVLALLPEASDQMWATAESAGLIHRTGGRISFRHPLVRSAVHQAASFEERRAAHLALADALKEDPDRRAWHLAAITTGPDKDVSAALEHGAHRARRRGGYAAAARALERAAELSVDRADHVRLIASATEMAVMTGQLAWVERLAALTRVWTDDPVPLAVAALQTGRIMAFTTSHTAAFRQLIAAARQLTAGHTEGALQALSAAAVIRFYSGEESQRDEIETLLLGMLGDPPADSLPFTARWLMTVAGTLDSAGLGPELPHLIATAEQQPERLHLLGVAAWMLDETGLAIRSFDASFALWSSRGPLPDGLGGVAAMTYLEHGRWVRAQALCAELAAVADTYGLDHAAACAASVDAMALALRGDTTRAREQAARAWSLIDPSESRAVAVHTHRALGIAATAAGDHEGAYAHFRAAFEADGRPVHYQASTPALPELAAAAVRSGHHREAADVIEYATRSGDSRSTRARALLLHSRALLADPDHAKTHFRAALALSTPSDRPFEHARILLDYAEWLRRRRRIAEARPLLTESLDVFRRLGARPWAARAQAELRATGTQVAAAEPDAFIDLTPQQQQIAHLAARGLTNREIGEMIFLSPRTVGSHLYRAFPKLGITARSQLRDVLLPTRGKRRPPDR